MRPEESKAKVLYGTTASLKIKEDLKTQISTFKDNGIIPCLAVIMVGNNSASKMYVASKKRACEQIGIKSLQIILPIATLEKELLDVIYDLNATKEVHGILVQLPLPPHIDANKIICAIDVNKDVDCFHPINVGRLMTGNPYFLPCTPAGIIELMNQENIVIEGRESVVLGRSNIVGKPIALLLLANNSTVTICHSKTPNLKEICQRADILVSAIGRPKFIKADYIKKGAIVIDVGSTLVSDSKTLGDVDFDNACNMAAYITPVPKGVGPMTVAMLMANTIKAVKIQNQGRGQTLNELDK